MSDVNGPKQELRRWSNTYNYLIYAEWKELNLYLLNPLEEVQGLQKGFIYFELVIVKK